MKYLKLSSVLVALFFVIGCGSKSVEKDGNTTKTKTEPQTIEQAPEENIVDSRNPNQGLPEGGFMGDNQGGTDDYDGYAGGNTDDMGNGNGMAGNNDADGNDAYAQNGDSDSAYGDVKVDALTTIYFDFDRYNIREDMKGYVRANADFIKENNIKAVVLQGNTDEFGGDEYNTALGLKRAISVRDALVMQGLPKNMFSTVSYGMHKPVCQEKTTECYAKNRRTDLVEKK